MFNFWLKIILLTVLSATAPRQALACETLNGSVAFFNSERIDSSVEKIIVETSADCKTLRIWSGTPKRERPTDEDCLERAKSNEYVVNDLFSCTEFALYPSEAAAKNKPLPKAYVRPDRSMITQELRDGALLTYHLIMTKQGLTQSSISILND